MSIQAYLTNNRINSQQMANFSIRYTLSIDETGWLMVKLKSDNSLVFLCEYTKVLITETKDERIYFKILEGPYAQKIASLKTENGEKCLISTTRDNGANLIVKILGREKETSLIREKEMPQVNPTFNQLFAKLSFNGISARITLDSEVFYKEENKLSPNYGKRVKSKPLPAGHYKILPPDYPKSKRMTIIYKTSSYGYSSLNYHTAWFPIEYAPNLNSNFVHVGHLSEGCITCYEIEKWNSLYLYLIRNRTANGKYVGDVIIK